ncbi:MAG: tyrosine-protein phosphatase [Promethearchaeia archaeon]
MEKELLIQEMNTIHPYFENFRDISLIPNKFSEEITLKQEVIYRSSSLAKYDIELISSFISENNIRWILDLRDRDEFETYEFDENFEYPAKFSDTYVKNIPMNPNIEPQYEEDYFRNLYYIILKDYHPQIRKVFDYIAGAKQHKLIIHCQAGVDRTGIVIALLLDLLGIKRNYIILDYELSERYKMNPENLKFLFRVIDEDYGGTSSYLRNYCHIPPSLLEKVKKFLLLD